MLYAILPCASTAPDVIKRYCISGGCAKTDANVLVPDSRTLGSWSGVAGQKLWSLRSGVRWFMQIGVVSDETGVHNDSTT